MIFLKAKITRTFVLDGDICEVVFYYDRKSGRYLGDYPDFDENPRYTVNGYRWVEAVSDGCAYMESKNPEFTDYDDCGSCKYFRREQVGDLIGICECKEMRRRVPEEVPAV